ncbi:hypothetical protein IFM89_026697 [Coptis chinensis]|uniref:Major facilitator superfamily (MFS) profile domain-containing protein n=1 Tax=Coptis chinensis TaxID=261450 RepID=A0A835LNQ8_9MAGN|nr:hypothetical protein IFM89_026697 [Coptis chinensis]
MLEMLKNKKELVNCISTLHSLLENPPGDFPDNIRKEIVEGLFAIWSLVSDEGNISHKLIKCINTYLLKDGPNLDREYLESIHSAVHGFAFRSWPKIQNLGLKPDVNSSVCPLGLFDEELDGTPFDYFVLYEILSYGESLTLLGLLGLDCQSALLLPLFVAFQVILTIAVFRVFVGVGEASFVSLAAPFIDDNAPVAQKTAWLAAFYMCIPGGIACGYVLGGLVASHFSWRWAFYGEAILIFPWAVLAFVIKPLSLKGFSDGKSIKGLTSGEVLPHEAEGTAISLLTLNE